MAYEDEPSYSGQKTIQTFGGRIKIEENRGRMIITDPVTNIERQVHDIDGSHYKDDNGDEMTLVNTLGISTIEPDTGIHRNRLGITTSDGRTGEWTSDDGEDVRTLLGE